ncbi:aldehyde ferredoxin oxidoreductase family protein [Chloroflexota bacterium]
MGGYRNRILRVNLSNRSFTEETPSQDLIHDFIGGRGFGARLLYDDLKPDTEPLGEDNELIFMAGPLAGTNAQCFSRLLLFFKSPLTGGYFRSAAGGYFAPEMKFAGFDAIIVSGIADKPVYLWIHDGKVDFRDATYLWGLNCGDAETLIRDELHDHSIRVAGIGPAGEHLVKYAGVFTDRRAAGRGGGGALMGSKNIKAIAVRGHEHVEAADASGFAKALKDQVKNIKNDSRYHLMSTRGRQRSTFANELGLFPTRNFREGVLPGWEKIADTAYDKLRVRNTTCHRCMVHCTSLTKIDDGAYAGVWSEGPEYETIWGFTGPFLLSDIGLTVVGDRICDELGLDTISVTGTMGFAYELYERGIIDKSDTGGLELTYGNELPVLKLLKQISYREGFGDVLAEGTREAARRIGKGSEQYAMHVKGLELPGYDPRGAKAHGLNMLTSVIGGSHMTGYVGQEIFGVNSPAEQKFHDYRFSIEGKGALCKKIQDNSTWLEVGTLCGRMTKDSVYGRLLATATGIEDFADTDYLWKVGERIYNLERMFNAREGFSRQDDAYPARFTSESMPDGPSAGQIFEQEELLDDYYRVRGWDPITGNPTPAKLDDLGLGFTK